MAKFRAQNLERNIPEEGQVFSLSTAPGYVFKRKGEGFLQLNPEDAQRFGISAPKFGITYGDLAQSLTGGFQRVTDPTPFRDTRITPGADISAIEATLRAQGLPAGSPVPGLTPGANIVAQPRIAPQSTIGVVAQGVADIQRRVDEIKGKPLTTASSAPTATPPFVEPQTPSVPSVSSIVGSALGTGGAGGVQLTSEQQKVQSDTEKTQQLYDILVGRSAYETEQKKAFGVPEKQDFIDDLTAQLMDLDFQAKAIPMQMQQQAEGRGITAAGLAPIETAALRKNAIQALGLSAQLAAAQGKLASADRRVKEAVEAKYGPIEAEIDAKLANLQLAQKSPAYTLAEKKQAAELELKITAQKEALNVAKTNEADVKKALNEAISNGLTDRKIMADIENSKDNNEAMMKVASYGYGTKKTERTQIAEIGGRKLLIDLDTGRTIKDLGASEGGGEKATNIINTRLYSVGLPFTIVSNKGKITDSHLTKLAKSGIPPTDAQEIMDEIVSGKSLEEIRQWMKSLGVDPKVLDTFMQTLQKEDSSGSKLDQILNKL